MAKSSPTKEKDVKNKRFMLKDINTSIKMKIKTWFFFLQIWDVLTKKAC
jgi:hypothetical protein